MPHSAELIVINIQDVDHIEKFPKQGQMVSLCSLFYFLSCDCCCLVSHHCISNSVGARGLSLDLETLARDNSPPYLLST